MLLVAYVVSVISAPVSFDISKLQKSSVSSILNLDLCHTLKYTGHSAFDLPAICEDAYTHLSFQYAMRIPQEIAPLYISLFSNRIKKPPKFYS